MKKFMLFASALAGLFLAASCQQDNLEPVEKGNTVTYTVEAPGALQTKAIADGMNVNELVYEVWITSANGTTNLNGAQKLYQATAEMFHEDGKNKATITLDLVKDQHYTVLFWAQVAEADAYNTTELTAVSYAKELDAYLANDESLAAFYAVDFVNDGVATNPTVLLKRPFAQVNLCTLNSKAAAQVAGDYNIALVNSKMTLESVPTTFNVATSDVDDEQTIEFVYNAVPGGDDKTITVNGENYYYAGMNYVFAGSNVTLTYDIQTSLNSSTNYATVNNVISDVPVRENYRTNIVGNLLTSTTDYEIIVDADFAGYENIPVVDPSMDAISAAIANAEEGATIVISGVHGKFPTVNKNITIVCEEGTVFKGNSKLNIAGATVVGATFSNPSGTAVDQTINGTFKNCTFEGVNGLRYAYAGETCVFEDCVFSGSTYGAHFDGGENEIFFKNCTFSGFNAFAAATPLVTFEGCTFVGNGKSAYNGANLWGSAKFVDTEFVFDGSTANEWIDAIGKDKYYEFTGCTINGGSIFQGGNVFSRNVGTKITIDGVLYTWAEGDYLVAEDGASVVSTAAGLNAALTAKKSVISLAPGRYEGTFKPLVATEFKSASPANKAVIAGRVNVGSIDCSFENIDFKITDASKHKNTYSGAPYQYPGIVVGYGAAMSFEGCDFEASLAKGVCGINAGNHADSSDLLIVNNCTFVGDFYAIRTRTLFNITNNVFDIYTDQGTLAAVWTWGNANSGANQVIFTGNTNQNANQVYGVQMTSSNFVYDYITINVQNNTNFHALADGVNSARFNGTHTFVEGSETF